jgi:hypothetical protein
VLYPKSIQWNDHSHHKFALAFKENSGYTSELSLTDAFENLQNEIDASDAKSVIISSELSPFYFDFEQFKVFAKQFDKVVIVFTLRRQSELLLSLYNQLVKDQNVRYPGSLFSLAMSNLSRFDFHNTVSRWAEIVGDENIRLVSYSDNVVDEFLNLFDVKLDRNVTSGDSVNSSIPNELLPGIIRVNAGVHDANQYAQNRQQVLNMRNDTDFKLSNTLFSIAEQRTFDNYFTAGNDKLSARFLNGDKLFKEKSYRIYKAIPAMQVMNAYKKNQATKGNK